MIGGCLATVSEISPAWDELITVVGTLTEGMKDRYSLERVLSGIDGDISNGILQAMDDGPRIYSKVGICTNFISIVNLDKLELGLGHPIELNFLVKVFGRNNRPSPIRSTLRYAVNNS